VYTDLILALRVREVVSDRPSAQGKTYQSSLGKEVTEVKKPQQNTKDSMAKHSGKSNSDSNKIILQSKYKKQHNVAEKHCYI